MSEICHFVSFHAKSGHRSEVGAAQALTQLLIKLFGSNIIIALAQASLFYQV